MPPRNSDITATDQFCGAGGSSIGAVARGIRVRLALNHWKLAIETHNTNFPDTDHDCTDVSAADPRRYPSTDILITSPECTTHSPAGGSYRGHPDVIVSSYHKLAGWADVLAPRIRSVVFDECQELRRPDSQKYAAAAHLGIHARYRLGLSATPIYNYGPEMYSVLSVLAPDALGSRAEFSREWCGRPNAGPTATIDDPKAFGSYLRDQGLMLRRTRKDVGRELPDVTRVVHDIDADPDKLETVRVSAEELAHTILAAQQDFRGQKLRAAEQLSMLLRQATGVAKAPHVAAFVRLLCESESKIVLYGWHHSVYAVWRDELSDLKPVFYTGEESPAQKDVTKQAFVEGDARVMIISLRAGAGLDGLQRVCRTVVFGELDWSPGVHEQCIGRIHRDGQPEPVLAYFLLADTGSDPVVADINGIKRQQSEAIRDPNADLVEKLAVDPSHVRRLAAAYLAQRGEAAPAGAAP